MLGVHESSTYFCVDKLCGCKSLSLVNLDNSAIALIFDEMCGDSHSAEFRIMEAQYKVAQQEIVFEGELYSIHLQCTHMIF